MTPLLTTEEAAALLRCSPETLKKWRHKGEGPTPTRMGRKVGYRPSVLEAWIEARTVDPVSERTTRRRRAISR